VIEKIAHNDEVIAIIIYKNYDLDGIQFVTPPGALLQLGHMRRPIGYRVVPHIHTDVRRETYGTQEVLFIKKGVVEIDFYSFTQEYLQTKTLSEGDIIFLGGAGHGLRVVEEATIVEVKNGPYHPDADKGRFEGRT